MNLPLLLIILSLFACQTAKQTDTDKKILASQRGIVVNYLNSGHPAQAHEELRKLLREHPDSVPFLGLMGVTQLALNNPNKAVYYLDRGYRLAGNESIGLNLSSALIAGGQLVRAENLLRELLAGKTYLKTERIYHNLGLVFQQRKDYRRAEHYYRLALSENPSYYLTLTKIGLLYKRQRRYRLAISHLKRATNFCRKCFEPVKYLSEAYFLHGNRQQSLAVIDRFSKQRGLKRREYQLAVKQFKLLANKR